jgi:hypothetical protein
MGKYLLMCLLMAALFVPSPVDARPRSVRLDIDTTFTGLAIRFAAPNWDSAYIMVRLGQDKLFQGRPRRALILEYQRLKLTPAVRDTLGKMLVRSGYPNESDMKFVRYLRRHWFRTVAESTTHYVPVFTKVPKGARLTDGTIVR